jgi:hypothetical protein
MRSQARRRPSADRSLPQRNGTCVTESERTPDSNHRLTVPNADYAHMMQLRKSRWMGTQIIQIGA